MSLGGGASQDQYFVTRSSQYVSPKNIFCAFQIKKHLVLLPVLSSSTECRSVQKKCQHLFQIYYGAMCLVPFSDYLKDFMQSPGCSVDIIRNRKLQHPCALNLLGLFPRETPLLMLLLHFSLFARVFLFRLQVHVIPHQSFYQMFLSPQLSRRSFPLLEPSDANTSLIVLIIPPASVAGAFMLRCFE